MKELLPYQTSFVLDKAHLSECFDQSTTTNGLKDYLKAMIVGVFGVVLVLWIDVDKYLAYFVVALAAVEGLSVYYKKSWWLWRQMLSKAYDHKVDLEISKQGVVTKSFHVNNELKWSEVTQVQATSAGVLLRHKGGVNYLSNSYLSDEIIEFIKSKGPKC